MSHTYRAFGLVVRSNRPLDGLREADTAHADVTVSFMDGHAPEVDEGAAASTATRGSRSAHRSADGGWLFRLGSHGGERAWDMRVSGDGSRIDIRWRGPVAQADIAALVEVTGLPAALTLRGAPLLHGCAIAREEGGAALVLGASGAGKSTTAAAAVAAGHSLLADDIAALDHQSPEIRVHAGGLRLRMNEDSASALGWDPSQLERVYVTPELPQKLFARLPATGGGARPVRAIFVLGERRRAAEPQIERLAPAAALPLLLANTYGDFAADARHRAALLPFWARLAREVPIHRVAPPDGIAAVPGLVDAMLPPPCAPPSSSSGPPAP